MQNVIFDENPHGNERIWVILGCAIGFLACAKHRCTGGWLKLCPDLKPYKHVFQELAQGVILGSDKLVIPEAEFTPGSTSLCETIVDLAHEGYQGVVKCKQLLRSRLWFPDLDMMVERKVAGCLTHTCITGRPRSQRSC